MNTESSTWICLDCAKQRGFRAPEIGAVAKKIIRCFYCDALGPSLDVDDLLRPWEDDLSEV